MCTRKNLDYLLFKVGVITVGLISQKTTLEIS